MSQNQLSQPSEIVNYATLTYKQDCGVNKNQTENTLNLPIWNRNLFLPEIYEQNMMMSYYYSCMFDAMKMQESYMDCFTGMMPLNQLATTPSTEELNSNCAR